MHLKAKHVSSVKCNKVGLYEQPAVLEFMQVWCV